MLSFFTAAVTYRFMIIYTAVIPSAGLQYYFFTVFNPFHRFPSEPPQFIKEPEKHITAEMEKVVDIPCQARGEVSALT